MGWRTDKSFVHVNRGLETKILMKKMSVLTGKFRVEAWERQLGGLAVKTSEQVYWEKEAVEAFNLLAFNALETTFNPKEQRNSPVVVIEEEQDAANT